MARVPQTRTDARRAPLGLNAVSCYQEKANAAVPRMSWRD